jgi:hypothetical protein
MVERLHRQLIAAILCHQRRCTEALPLVFMGIRSAWKENWVPRPLRWCTGSRCAYLASS